MIEAGQLTVRHFQTACVIYQLLFGQFFHLNFFYAMSLVSQKVVAWLRDSIDFKMRLRSSWEMLLNSSDLMLNLSVNSYISDTYWPISIENHSRSGDHVWYHILTLPMLSLLSSKEQGRKDFWKPSKPCHVGINWIALIEDSQMSTHVPGFQSFFRFLQHFVLAKLATSSIRVNGSF